MYVETANITVLLNFNLSSFWNLSINIHQMPEWLWGQGEPRGEPDHAEHV